MARFTLTMAAMIAVAAAAATQLSALEAAKKRWNGDAAISEARQLQPGIVTRSPSQTHTPSHSPTHTRTQTPSRTRTATHSATMTRTASHSPTQGGSPSTSPTITPSQGGSASATSTVSASPTPSPTYSSGASPPETPSMTASATVTPSNSPTPSLTPSNSMTPSASPSFVNASASSAPVPIIVESSGLTGGQIAGIVIGVLIALALIGALVMLGLSGALSPGKHSRNYRKHREKRSLGTMLSWKGQGRPRSGGGSVLGSQRSARSPTSVNAIGGGAGGLSPAAVAPSVVTLNPVLSGGTAPVFSSIGPQV